MDEYGSRGIDRRDFAKRIAIGAAGIAATSFFNPQKTFAAQEKKGLVQPSLPYALDALEPYISKKTVDLHYIKHHKGYYDLVSKQIKGTEYADIPLSEIILKTHGSIKGIEEATFYMALLAWNHDLYWKSMKPGGGGKLEGNLGKKIDESFGSFDAFRREFVKKAMMPGSGWVWLAYDGDELLVSRTTYHDNALLDKQIPLVTIDVWEHAYYMDYQNEKENYIDAWFDKLVNWDFAGQKFDLARKEKKG
ncbi:MAG: superoxide dismutase [Chitinivibrionales bacterium]|nr:superoxide dismutase [Chitinivibrionales bacterium]